MLGNQHFVVQQRANQLQARARHGTDDESVAPLVDKVGGKLVSAELDDGWLVLQYLSGTSQAPQNRLELHDLTNRDARAVVLGSRPGIPAPGLPQAFDLGGGHLVYASQAVGSTNCLVDLELTSMTARTVHCTDRPSQGVGNPEFTEFGIMFSEWTPGEPDGRGCAVLQVVADDPRGGEPVETVPSQRSCGAWTGLVGDEFWVWSEPLPRVPDEAEVYALTLTLPGADVVELGRGDTGSPRLCGDNILWLSTSEGASVINRWWPGDEVEELYAMPEGAMLISRLRCEGSLVTFHLSADGPDRVALMGIDLG